MTSLRELAVASFAHHLVTATVNLGLHSPASPHVQVNLEALLGSLVNAEQTGVPMPLQLEFGGGQIHHQGRALRGPSLQAGQLLRLCEERSIRSLTFDPKLDAEEVLRFLILLRAIQKRDAFDRGKIAAAFGVAGIRYVSIDAVEPPASGDPGDDHQEATPPRR